MPIKEHHGNLITSAAAAVAKSLQSRLTLCDPIDGSPPGSSVHGIHFVLRVAVGMYAETLILISHTVPTANAYSITLCYGPQIVS